MNVGLAAESRGCGARISPVLVEYVILFDPLNACLASESARAVVK